jgi:hypothetical protein
MDNDYRNWRKSHRSNGSGQCVETASNRGTVAVRDTANREGAGLVFTAGAWAKFTARLK